MVGAPVTVGAALLLGRSVLLVFALYHLGICLVLPGFIDLRVRRWPLRHHLRHIGLAGADTRQAIGGGLLLAAATFGVVLALLHGFGDRLLAGADVAAALARWGLAPAGAPALVLFMALVNGPAEELFWRGFVAAECRSSGGRAGRMLMPSLLFASYHAVTIPALVRVPWGAALMVAAVVAAGVGWAWLRERTGSVWPALLSHAAATAAYMLHGWPLLRT